MARLKKDDDEHQIYYRVAPLGILQVYLVSDAELEKLASGPDGQLELSFASALIPTGLSLIISLQTAVFTDRWFVTYAALAAVSMILRFFMLIKWLLVKNSRSDLLNEIRSRMPPEPAESIIGPVGPVGPGLSFQHEESSKTPESS